MPSMKGFITIMAMCALIAVGTGCQRSSVPAWQQGELVRTTYTNKSLGLTMHFPEDWSVTMKERMQLRNKESDDEMPSAIQLSHPLAYAAGEPSYHLLTGSQRSGGRAVDEVSSISFLLIEALGEERLDPADYLKRMEQAATREGIPFELIRPIEEREVAGRPFFRSDFLFDTPLGSLAQSVLITDLKPYLLVVYIASDGEEGLEPLIDLLDNLTFS
jgi:hypothetical protein